jgi:hypothetical protein
MDTVKHGKEILAVYHFEISSEKIKEGTTKAELVQFETIPEE